MHQSWYDYSKQNILCINTHCDTMTMTAAAARKSIALNVPINTEEQTRANVLLKEHEPILERKIAEGRWEYTFVLRPHELMGKKSYEYDLCDIGSVREIANAVANDYVLRGFKCHFSITDPQHNFCKVKFNISWHPDRVAVTPKQSSNSHKACIVS
jgi:hypothetical protein